MTVYVDQLRPTKPRKGWPYKYSCHLTADTIDELHEFASKIGMRREWFQDHAKFPHYDLTGGRRKEAVRAGAVEESTVAAVRRMLRASRPDDFHTRLVFDDSPRINDD